MLIAPPLSLYIHIPWCVEKCPYCDFNSHALKHAIPEQDYIAQLLLDLDTDITRFNLSDRPLHSIFIGGGTPSLFSAPAIEQLLTQVLQRFEHKADIEITLEANPGTVEADKFIGFFNGGVSRLSVGVQSFASDKLIKLGRIHDSQQAKTAANLASECGVKSFNLDLMHGLPDQSVEHALDDLKTAISLNPTHISWYQLTIEPNTAFHSKPPKLPQDEVLWNIQDQGIALLNQAGYQQYEISAYSKPEYQCQHNLNYWQFGDYLGIGCGAHGKITDVDHQKIYRTVKVKHPKGYLDTSRKALDKLHTVTAEELSFEYMMNRLRLFSGFSLDDYQAYTGLNTDTVLPTLLQAKTKGLMEFDGTLWSVSKLGHRYLNDLLEMFL
ncbi:radical SAM family heme chaperone HemW [Colwellia sp. M166]|uniref:radical SAM family heme chaperone HemW n=1 Tax=Colwellia sp. M166 TaxID=2583805 RepID=UPI00211ED37D|nr:radical SAM family heme chaperone HemW [Colwellia sp. M166]UUO24888.1 radical SAM family heme chaperone HemW [Colwellia sp. M166]|tara:strand:- start:844 stop:1989 length:1146 start_codon:yes stop_codon:yes gene_type:complete